MSYKEAFLQAIVENPDDDTPRLIYADWLEEYGDLHRAEFIRVQCELARLPIDDDVRRPTLQEHEWTLLFAHAKEWLAELPIQEGIKWHEGCQQAEGILFPASSVASPVQSWPRMRTPFENRRTVAAHDPRQVPSASATGTHPCVSTFSRRLVCFFTVSSSFSAFSLSIFSLSGISFLSAAIPSSMV